MPFVPSPAAAPPPVEVPAIVPLGRFLLTLPPELALKQNRREFVGMPLVRSSVAYKIGGVEVREFVLEELVPEAVPEAIFVEDLWRRHLEEREGQLRERLYAHERAGFRLVPDAGARLPTARHSVLRQLNATVPEDLVWEGAYVREGVLLWLAATAWRSDTKDTTGEVALLVESVAGAYRSVEAGAARTDGGFHTLRGVVDLPPTLPERASASFTDVAHAAVATSSEDVRGGRVELATLHTEPESPSAGERMGRALLEVSEVFRGMRRVRKRPRVVAGLSGEEMVVYLAVTEGGASEAGFDMTWASDGAAQDGHRPRATVKLHSRTLPPRKDVRRRVEPEELRVWDALLDGLRPVELGR